MENTDLKISNYKVDRIIENGGQLSIRVSVAFYVYIIKLKDPQNKIFKGNVAC